MTAAEIEGVPTDAKYPVHPVAEMFPLITGAEFDQFVEDVRVNGLRDPIVLDREGQLIDGRNRLRACVVAGIEPRTEVYDGPDVTAYIVSHNIHRRHLTDSQRAMIAARIATRPPGHRTAIVESHLTHMSKVTPSIEQAADMLAVTRESVTRARRIVRNGLPALQELVIEGRAPVTTAARVAQDLDFTAQQQYVEKVRAGADPVKAAPLDQAQMAGRERRAERAGKAAPKPIGARHADVLASVNNTLRVWRENNLTFTELDSSVTAEKAALLEDDLSQSIKRLNAIRRLLNDRMKESTE